MAELSTLARPYAKAAYEFAAAADTLGTWSAMLKTLSAVVQDAVVKSLLEAPGRSAQEQSDTLVELCGDALDDKGVNLVRLLAQNRRLPLIPFISEQFEALKAQREQTVEVELISAKALGDDQSARLAQALGKKLDRQVNVRHSIDPSLIGGVLIRAGDTVIDGSIRGRLNKLAEALNS